MAKPNQITFDGSKYGKPIDMWEDITRTLQTLMRNDYVCTLRCDEPAFEIYVIEFDYADDAIAKVQPYWLEPEQYERVKEENNAKIH